jgi:glycosyltransferase involved in cell wall biosynthesis
LKEKELEKLISIVIPAKNEELFIASCIEGAIKALKNIKSWEIILVDSYSTDNTVEIAKQYPIKIFRLKKEWFKSPDAGRYIGTINSSGKYIFFLDADMIVAEGWIETALKALEKNENLAGITGILYNVLPDEGINKNHRINHPIGYVDYFPGTCIYKKDVLNRVNHFNPYFKGNGEREIGYRISKEGWSQIRIEKEICYHYKKEYDFIESFEKASYFIGVGQFLRLHFKLENVKEMIVKYKIVFSYMAFLLILISFLFTAAFLNRVILNIILLLIIVVIATLFLIRKRRLKKFLLRLNGLTLASINFLYGFIKKPKSFADYPLDVEIIKDLSP